MEFQKRGFASLLLTFSFIVASFSGVVLYLTPRGRTAGLSDWTMLGLDRLQWTAVHINTSLLVLIIAVWHLCLNWSVFRSYMKKAAARGLQFKQEMLLALLFTVVVTAGSCLYLPPFRAAMSIRYEIKNYWDHQAVVQVEDAGQLQTVEQHGSDL